MSFVPIEGVMYPERTEAKMDNRGPGCILSTERAQSAVTPVSGESREY
jgi:hypothetical protein